MLTVRNIPAGTIGFDSDTKISPALAQEFRRIGYRFVIRYVSLEDTEAPGDIDKPEVQGILAAGLGLMWVQHTRGKGWVPSAALGLADGTNAVTHAINAGIPAGVMGACDLEGISVNAGLKDILDYARAWHGQVAKAGYVPVGYIGANTQMDSAELAMLPFDRLWRSCSTVPDVARGYSMHQTECDMEVLGIWIDRDVAQANANGQLMPMLVDCEAYLSAVERWGNN